MIFPKILSQNNLIIALIFGMAIIFANACSVNQLFSPTPELEPYYANYEEKLGHLLFFDVNLSKDRNISCSTCHNPQLAFTDGYRKSFNSRADVLSTNSPTLLNLHTRSHFHSTDSTITDIRIQLLKPLFSEIPAEMGFMDREEEVLNYINTKYKKIVKKALDSKETFTIDDLISALEAYVMKLQSYESAYDKYIESKDPSFLSEAAFQGMKLFFSERLGCTTCHGGINFHQPKDSINYTFNEYKTCDTSLSKKALRIPTLRNVMISHPYYHDGSTHYIEEVLRNYERGHIEDCGRAHPIILEERLSKLKKFALKNSERAQLIAFFHTLTDTSYLKKPFFIEPQSFLN